MPKAKGKGKGKGKKRDEPEEVKDDEKKGKKGAAKASKKAEVKVAAKKKVAAAKKEPAKADKPKKEEKKKGKAEKKAKEKGKKDEDKVKDTKAADKADTPKEEKKMVTGIKKGKAMVDAKVPNGSNYHVFEDAGKVYAASLMWSDLKNNNNKFYIVQLLQEDKNGNAYMVWNRWGRVGVDGQFANFRFTDPQSAIHSYEKKYNEKLGKGYTEIEINYDEEETEKKKPEKKGEKADDDKESKLDDRVQKLVKLIFNMKLMQKQMVEIGYDAKKMPLGKLSKETIKKGYEVLQKISDVLEKKTKGDLLDLSSKFYTVIPHDFGFK